MSETCTNGGIRGTIAASFLSLAAAPTFATMALLTAVQGGGSPDVLCSTEQHASPFSGMVAMYVLMSLFHSAPWLKLWTGAALGRRETAPRHLDETLR